MTNDLNLERSYITMTFTLDAMALNVAYYVIKSS